MSEKSKEMVENKDFYRSEPYIKEEKILAIRGESSADLVLPDYMGDVKRLLKFSALATPCSKYCRDSEASFLGTVTYRVMYLDNEDKLTEASFTSEYEHERALPESYVDASIETEVQSVSVRLVGPRKMSARASLLHNVYVSRECKRDYEGLGADHETLKCEKKVHGAKYLESEEKEIAEELGRLDGVSSDEVSVVKCECTAEVKSVDVMESSLDVKGEVCLSTILSVGEEILRLEKKIPFEETVHSEGVLPKDSKATAMIYSVSSVVNVNNENSQDGVGCYAAVVMNASFECTARVDCNTTVSFVTDAFLPGSRSECEYEDVSVSEMIFSSSEARSFTAQTTKKEWGVDKIRDVMECDAKANNVRCELVGDELSVEAEIVFSVVARESGENSFMSLRCPLEYKRTVKLPASSGNRRTQAMLSVFMPRLMHDSDKLYFACDVCEDLRVESENTVRVLKSITEHPIEEDRARRISVLFTAPEESVFDIARRYSVPCATVTEGNLGVIPEENVKEPSLPLGATKRVVIIR